MLALAVVLAALATADDPPPPSADEVIARLERTEASFRNLSVAAEFVSLQREPSADSELIGVRFTTMFVVDREGRLRHEWVGEMVNLGPGGTVKLVPSRGRNAYDGEVATSLSGSYDGSWATAGLDRHPSYRGINPLESTTHYFGEPVSRFLGPHAPRVVGVDKFDERPTVIVEGEPKVVDGDGWKYRFWVDMERGVVVRRAGLIQKPGQEWREYTRIESRAHEEIRPGVWLPTHVKYESLDVRKPDGRDRVLWSNEGRNIAWEVDRELPDGFFRLAFPASAVVTDRRKADEK